MFTNSGMPATKVSPVDYSGTITPTITNVPLNTTGTFSGPKGAVPMTDAARFAGYTATGSTPANFTDIEQKFNLPDGALSKIMGVESTYGTNPKAFNLTAGPSGIFQMTEDIGRKFGIVGPGFDFRNDPVAAAPAAAAYAAEISNSLGRTLGRTPTAGEIGLGYNQGAAGAAALLSNPNLPAAEALAPAYGGDIAKAARAISNNKGDPNAPASQFSGKISGMYENTPANTPTLAASLQNLSTGVGTAFANLTAAATSAPGKFANTLQSILDSGKTKASPDLEAGNMADFGVGNKASMSMFADPNARGFVIPGTDEVVDGNGKPINTSTDIATVAKNNPEDFGSWLDSTLKGFLSGGDTIFNPSKGIRNPAGYSLGLDNQDGQDLLDQYAPSPTVGRGSSDSIYGGGKDQVVSNFAPTPTSTPTTTPIPPVNTPKGIEALNLDLARRKYVNRGSVKTTSAAYPDYEYNSRFS
jgi:hypothetical protein